MYVPARVCVCVCVSGARLRTQACTSIHNTVGTALRLSEPCDVYIQKDEKEEEAAERINVSHVSRDAHADTHIFWRLENELVAGEPLQRCCSVHPGIDAPHDRRRFEQLDKTVLR